MDRTGFGWRKHGEKDKDETGRSGPAANEKNIQKMLKFLLTFLSPYVNISNVPRMRQ